MPNKTLCVKDAHALEVDKAVLDKDVDEHGGGQRGRAYAEEEEDDVHGVDTTVLIHCKDAQPLE